MADFPRLERLLRVRLIAISESGDVLYGFDNLAWLAGEDPAPSEKTPSTVGPPPPRRRKPVLTSRSGAASMAVGAGSVGLGTLLLCGGAKVGMARAGSAVGARLGLVLGPWGVLVGGVLGYFVAKAR